MEKQEIVKTAKIVNPGCGSKNFKLAISIVGAMLLALVIFAGGVAVGIHKARFSYQWGQNYERNFMGSGFGCGASMPEKDGIRNDSDAGRGPKCGEGEMMSNFFRGTEGRDFRNAHGLAGAIISITESNIVIKDRDNKENTVAINDKTIIKKNIDDLKISDLKTGDQLVVMGTPNDQGVINADLIRVFGAMTEN